VVARVTDAADHDERAEAARIAAEARAEAARIAAEERAEAKAARERWISVIVESNVRAQRTEDALEANTGILTRCLPLLASIDQRLADEAAEREATRTNRVGWGKAAHDLVNSKPVQALLMAVCGALGLWVAQYLGTAPTPSTELIEHAVVKPAPKPAHAPAGDDDPAPAHADPHDGAPADHGASGGGGVAYPPY
jgi:hypothetical protein